MRKIRLVLAYLIGGSALLGAPMAAASTAGLAQGDSPASYATLGDQVASPAAILSVRADDPISPSDLQLAMRDLWTNHIFWVRSVVLAANRDDSGAATAAEAQVVENARAIADAVIPFYGQEGADGLFELLAGHWGGIKQYMEAAFDNKDADKDKASQAIVDNAEAIADFLDGANPNLPKDTVLPLLMAHGGHHMQQIELVKKGDFTQEATVWRSMLDHIYTVSDALAGAISKQFPDLVKAEK